MLGTKICVGFLGILSIMILLNIVSKCRTPKFKLNAKILSSNTKLILNMDELPKHDYSKLIDINFQFDVLNLVCSNKSSEILVLILVHSSTTHFLRREMIRNTWGKVTEFSKVVFLVGRALDEEVNIKIRAESLQNGDIVQGDFLDTYHNITYKHTMGMKYFLYHCSVAKYILKVDDDILVNTPMLKKFLSEEVSPYGAENVIMCNTIVHARTLRSYRSKWRISFEEYPHRYFPTFCRGMAIVYSPDIVFKLYGKAQITKKYIKLDDVFYTGITAESVGFTGHSNLATFVSFLYKDGGNTNIPKNLSSYLFVGSELSGEDILKMWNQLDKYNTM